MDRPVRIGMLLSLVVAAVAGGDGWFFIAAGSALLVRVCLEATTVSRNLPVTFARRGPAGYF
jgi:hypothetical protein